MTAYGLKTYGTFKYGVASTTDISAYPFIAKSFDYGSINLSWTFPLSTALFSDFIVVRNPMSFPVTADNGDLIYKTTQSYLQSNNLFGSTATLTDSGGFYDLVSGIFTPSYTAITTLLSSQTAGDAVNTKTFTLTSINSNVTIGQYVTYTPSGSLTGANSGSGIVGGTKVVAIDNTSSAPLSIITLSDYATIPAGTTLTFAPTRLKLGKPYYYSAFVYTNYSWQRVGTATGISINNYKTADVMYDSLPSIYRAALPASSSVSDGKNLDLYNLLRPMALQYDYIKTKVDNATNRYDITNVDGTLIPALMDQMGLIYESNMGIHQGRRLATHASYIYLNKGTGQGLKQFISSFSGYNVSIAPIKNLFLTLDCSSFEYGDGFWNNSGTYSTLSKTTAALEGGSPSPYAATNSPFGYPNKQNGYLKMSTVAASGGPYTTYEISYGASLDTYTISKVSAAPAVGANFITLTTDTEHSFIPGQSVMISDMYPPYINGIKKILAAPDSKSFTFYSADATASVALRPYGSAVIPTGTITGGTKYATITTAAAHYIVPGQSVTISNVVITGSPANAYFAGTSTPINSTYVAAAGTTGSTLVITLPTDPTDTTVTGAGSVFVSPGTVNLYDVKNAGIPVTAGTTYMFSAYTWAKTTLRSITLGAKWYDQYGTYLSSNSASSNNAVGSWTRLSWGSGNAAPDSAAYAVPYISFSTAALGEVHYFDALQFEASSTATNYADPRRIDLYVGAPRINEIINPGFKSGTTNWAATNGTLAIDASNVYPTSAVGLGNAVSVNSAKLTTSSASSTLSPSAAIAITAGNSYSLSAYVKGNSGNTGGTVTSAVTWKNPSIAIPTQTPTGSTNITLSTTGIHGIAVGSLVLIEGITPSGYNGQWTAQIGTTNSTLVVNIGSNPGAITVAGTVTPIKVDSSLVTLSNSSFKRVTVEGAVAPVGATTATITFTYTGTSGNVYFTDSILFEKNLTVNTYFDGDTGYFVVDDLIWEQNAAGTKGTDSTARSLYFPNRSLVQSRLNTVLPDYLPIGSTFALFIGTTAT